MLHQDCSPRRMQGASAGPTCHCRVRPKFRPWNFEFFPILLSLFPKSSTSSWPCPGSQGGAASTDNSQVSLEQQSPDRLGAANFGYILEGDSDRVLGDKISEVLQAQDMRGARDGKIPLREFLPCSCSPFTAGSETAGVCWPVQRATNTAEGLRGLERSSWMPAGWGLAECPWK